MSCVANCRRDGPVAVIGMACRFPGEATCPLKFWDMLKNGRDAYSPDTDRYNTSAFYHATSNDRHNVLPTKGGHFIKEDPYAFDTAFFKLSAAEASILDPKQRISLEIAYEALENAGLPLQKVKGTQTACYMGTNWSDYRDALAREFQQWPRLYHIGVNDEFISNRLSHFFDFHGPSVTVQTACSSSLVAIHQACESLRSGEARMALAGGVNMILTPDATMELQNVSLLSPGGHSLSFDEDANGYARGEGCGIVVLKLLDDAVRDGDPIRAVIRASGVNSDGWTKSISQPSTSAQEDLIRFVYESNGLTYSDTQYVEAHGTGTRVGDPIELKAIHNTIGQAATNSRKLYVGSVKTNIGHLEPAAGVAGFIKGVLALENSVIPPNTHFHKANPAIRFEDWNMEVPIKLTPWPVVKTKRLSISSFGVGGTNSTLVLEEYKRIDHHPQSNGTNGSHGPNSSTSNNGFHSTNGHSLDDEGMLKSFAPKARITNAKKRLFVFSSHDQAGTKRVCDLLLEHIDRVEPSQRERPEYLANLAHTLSVVRSKLTWRASCIADSISALREQLAAGLSEKVTRASRSGAPRIAFVFTGQGAQWAGMGVELLQRPVFGDSVAKSALILKELGCGWDPVVELCRKSSESRLGLPEISQPICTVLQVALVDEVRSWGISQPAKVVGHSSGEIAAAYCVGALTHRDAIAVAYFRGKASALLPVAAPHLNGSMMAAGCNRETAETMITSLQLDDQVMVACVNSPSSITLSGDFKAIERMAVELEEQGLFCRRLKVDVAYHSSHMSAVCGDYYEMIADIEPVDKSDVSNSISGPRMISSVLSEEVAPNILGAFYWFRNLISPVLFSDAMRELLVPGLPASPSAGSIPDIGSTKLTASVDLLIEIGPHSTLRGPIEQILSHHGIQGVTYQSVLRRDGDSLDTSLQLAQRLFHHGVPLEMSQVNGDLDTRLLMDLPPYPWMHDRKYDAYSRLHKERMRQNAPMKSLLGASTPKMQEQQHVWRGFIRLDNEPWLRGHTVGGTVVFPAAGMLSMVLEAVQQLSDKGKKMHSLRLYEVSVFAAMSILDDTATEVVVTLRSHLAGQTSSASWEFTVSSSNGSQLRDNSRGLVAIDYEEGRSEYMIYENANITAQRITEYQDVVRELQDQAISKEDLYLHLTKLAFKYAGIFQGVENVHPGEGKAYFDIRINDLGKTFSKGQIPGTDNRPFIIHAGTMDNIFQTWIASTYRDGALFDKPFAPISIREMEVRMDIPGDPDDVLPGYNTTKRHGSNEHTSDIFVFDQTLSRICVSVFDLHISDLESTGVEGADAKHENVAESIATAEVRWDYSLGHLKPVEIAGLVHLADETVDRLAHLVRLILHEQPATSVIELVQDDKSLFNSVVSYIMSKPGLLPKGSLPPSYVRYAVVETAGKFEKIEALHGEPFPLGDKNASLPTESDRLCADLLIIPQQSLSNLSDLDRKNVLSRFLSLAKPGATLLLAAEGPTAATAAAQLETYGLQLWVQIPGQRGVPLSLYRYPKEMDDAVEVTATSSADGTDFIVVTPSTPSIGPEEFFSVLKDALFQHDERVFVKSLRWSELAVGSNEIDKFSGKSVIFLLEVEQPMLYDLSEHDFEILKSIVVRCERLLFITCGDDPLLQIVDGLGRTIRSEIAGFQFQILHLSSGQGMLSGPALVIRILTGNTSETEFREVDGLLQTSRVYKSLSGDEQMTFYLEDATLFMPLHRDKVPRMLAIGRPGLLDTLHFVKDDRVLKPLADTDVEIQVKVSGMNFKDVMGAMGLISVPELGLEASGVVMNTGKIAATRYKPGDRVAVLAFGCHATTLRTHHNVVAKMPEEMTFEQAAAIGIVHITAYYALIRVARLRKGQSVLIHTAAGGVGQAAVQLAKYLDLVIYVTVGSEAKRQFMMDRFGIPESNIFYSRDLSFVKGIVRVTGGRGIDCILNSLADELLRGTWDSDCLAPFGTFVEIGLRDITNNSQLNMRPFKKNATFTFLDIMMNTKEDLGEVFSQVMELVSKGHLSVASPLQTYRVGQVEEVFRMMQQGKHRGKSVISFTCDSNARVFLRAKEAFALDPAATYLLVGGMGGLGRSLARCFVDAGARNLAFLSRSGDTSKEAQDLIAELTQRGVEARVYRSDITNSESFRDAMTQCSRDLPPVKGVVQLAMVLRDTVFEKMSYAQWAEPLRPKVQGSRNLHNYFDGSNSSTSLDFLILCSSVSGVIGNPGQASYAAGNTYQDALAHYRQTRGLKTVALDLGVMRDVGVIAEKKTEIGVLKKWQEITGISETVFHAIVKSVIDGLQHAEVIHNQPHRTPTQVVTGLGAADIWAANGLPAPHYLQDKRFGPLAVTASKDASLTAGDEERSASVASRLTGAASMEQAAEIVKDVLVHRTAEILALPATEIDPTEPLYRYGIDSLTAIELRNWISRELQANMALLEIVSAIPIHEFAIKIAENSKLVSSSKF